MIEAEAQLLVYSADSLKEDSTRAYAHYVHDLLGGQIHYTPLATEKESTQTKQSPSECDLIVFGESEQSCLEQMLIGHLSGTSVDKLPASLLWARQPRWPIRNILLVIRFEETDVAAVEWIGRLARPSGAAITMLPIVPSLPVMYKRGNRVQTGLDLLLSSNSSTGQSLRRLAQRMSGWQIHSDLRLRQGEPAWQLREELAQRDYDLVVIGAGKHGRSHQLLLSELASPLLHSMEQSLLIAQPTVNHGALL